MGIFSCKRLREYPGTKRIHTNSWLPLVTQQVHAIFYCASQIPSYFLKKNSFSSIVTVFIHSTLLQGLRAGVPGQGTLVDGRAGDAQVQG